jgi:hypothetical protein
VSRHPADPAEQARRSWQAWLDAVARAAADVHDRAAHPAGGPGPADGTAPAVGADAHLPPMPAAAFPAALEARRREVLERLAAATAAAERRRDELAAELARLAPVATRPPRSYGDGATLDVVG